MRYVRDKFPRVRTDMKPDWARLLGTHSTGHRGRRPRAARARAPGAGGRRPPAARGLKRPHADLTDQASTEIPRRHMRTQVKRGREKERV